MPINREVTAAPAAFSRTRTTSCGSAALPRMTVSVTLVPGAPRSRRAPSNTDMSRVGLVSIATHEVAGLQPCLGRGGAVARGDDPQVVLARQLQADVAIGQRLAGCSPT